MLYVGSYDGKFYALDARTGTPRWKFATGGERRFEAKGLHGLQPKNQTIADPFDVFLSSPVVGGGSVYLRQRRRQRLRARRRDRANCNGNSRPATSCTRRPRYADGVVYFGSWDSYFYAVDARTGEEKWRFHGGEDPLMHNQVGFQSSPAVVNGVVYVGLPRFEPLRARRGDRQGKVALQQRRQLGDQLARRDAGQGVLRHVGLEPLPRARRGRPASRSPGSKARRTCSLAGGGGRRRLPSAC